MTPTPGDCGAALAAVNPLDGGRALRALDSRFARRGFAGGSGQHPPAFATSGRPANQRPVGYLATHRSLHLETVFLRLHPQRRVPNSWARAFAPLSVASDLHTDPCRRHVHDELSVNASSVPDSFL